MFLVRIFRDSFFFNRILKLRSIAFWKFLIYFFIITVISLFSFNFTNLKEGGWKLGFVEYNFTSSENNNFKLPSDIVIRQLSGVNSLSGNSQAILLKDSKNGDIMYRFLINEEGLVIDKEVRQLIFTDKNVYYVKGDGKSYIVGDYNNFPEETSFEAINNITNPIEKTEALKDLAKNIEKSFGSQNAFYTIMVFSSIQILLYVVLIAILAAVLQLFRFGYTKYMSYFDSVKIVIAAMTIPSVISFIIGFFTHALTPVIVQLGLGIILMIVMLKYGKNEFSA